MRHLLWLMLLVPGLHAQVAGPGSVTYQNTAPSGSCNSGQGIIVNYTTGTAYTCSNGTWAAISGGSGTFNALTQDATSTSTGGTTEVTGLLTHALPTLTTGYLNWTGTAWALSAVSGGSAFNALTSGTNTGAAMLVGTGASLGPTGTGTISANEVNGATAPASACAIGTNSSNQLIGLTCTGTGNNVLATSPTLVTPNLGTPSSAVLTNATGLPLGSGVTGNLPYANLAALSANTLLGALTATTPSGLSVPNCSGASNALSWTSGTGFGCNTISGSGSTTNALTLNNGGSGATSGTTFNGSAAVTLSYNTIGAAPLASPTFTGVPAGPTATSGTNTTQFATTAFIQTALGSYAPIASPTFTGTVTIPALTLSGITGSTQCLQTSTGGVVSGTGAACGTGGSDITLQTNGTNNTSQSALNFITSTTNAAGLTVTPSNPTSSSEKFEVTGNVPNASLATQTANTVLGALTATTPSGLAVPACTGGLTWTSGTGFGCDTLSGYALLASANTFSATNTFSAAGAASTPGVTISGAPYIAGSTTTNFPQLYLNSGATAPTSFNSAGTVFGINSPSGFSGNFLDFHPNGAASVFAVSSSGAIQSSSFWNGSTSYATLGSETANTGFYGFSSTSNNTGTKDTILCRLGAAGVVGVESAATCTNTTAGATGGFATGSLTLTGGTFTGTTGLEQVAGVVTAIPLGGSGAGLTTGPTTAVSGDVTTMTGTAGQIADSGVLLTSLAHLASPTFTGTTTVPALTLSSITGSTQCLQVSTSGVVSGTGTTCGSGGGSGLSGMTAGQVPIAATATTVTSSEPLAGAGAGIVTGPTSSTVAGDVVTYQGTTGQVQDSGTALTALAPLSSPNFTTPSLGAATASSISVGSSPPACTAGTAGADCLAEGTAPTNVSGADAIYADSTTHELKAATNGSSTFGILNRTAAAIHLTAQTASISTATLCAASAGACNVAGEYHIHLTFYNTGTACTTAGTGGVTPTLTWTDTNGTAHSAQPFAMNENGSITFVTKYVPASGALTSWASGDIDISTNGSVIQYATTYAGCTTGTLTYQMDAAVTRLQ